MTSTQVLIGPLMIDVGGLRLDDEDRELLGHPLVGGMILFARNFEDRDQLRELCREVRAVPRKQPLLMAVDHEGGRIQRFRKGFAAIPPMRDLGKRYVESPALALSEAADHGFTIGSELAAFGIDLCFAPVLDRDIGVSGVIGDRAFSDAPDAIIALARAFRSGLNRAGMAATGKHFPGHGAVAADSHLDLPVDDRSLEHIRQTELIPFVALASDPIESLMMAHVRYSRVDPIPASFSPRWIRQLLRAELQYDGAIFCDDLSMKGAAVIGDMEARTRAALDAGCDMLPVCNDRPALRDLIKRVADIEPDPIASRRLSKMYLTKGPR